MQINKNCIRSRVLAGKNDGKLMKIDENWLWSRVFAGETVKIHENGLWSRGSPSGQIFWRPLLFLLFPYLQMALPGLFRGLAAPGPDLGGPPPPQPVILHTGVAADRKLPKALRKYTREFLFCFVARKRTRRTRRTLRTRRTQCRIWLAWIRVGFWTMSLKNNLDIVSRVESR